MKKVLIDLLYPLFVVLLILLIWQVAAFVIDVDLILPRPLAAFKEIGNYFTKLDFWTDVGFTYLRCIASFFIAALLGGLFAVLAYIFPTMSALINPFVAFIRAIPTMSVILILVIVVSPRSTPLIVATIVIFPTLYQAIYLAFKDIDVRLLEMAKAYKVPLGRKIFKLYLPCVMPNILGHFATGFSLNIKLVIAAEALAQTRNSIGKLMQYAKISLEMEKLFALTIIAVVLSLISEAILKFTARKVCSHYGD